MYVSVKYHNQLSNAYTSSPFTYTTDLPLKVGDLVLAPTAKAPEGSRAIVSAVDIPAPGFKCKEITRYYIPTEG